MSPAVPSEATEDVLIWDGETLWATTGHGHLDRTVTWERLPEPTSFPAGGGQLAAQYQGTVNTMHPPGWLNGWAYYVRQGSEYVLRGPTGHGQSWHPPNDLGTFAYEDDAEDAVRAVGDIAAFVRDGETQRYPNRVTAYTPGTPANYRLVPVRYLPDPSGKGGFIVTAKQDGTGFELSPVRPSSIPEVGTIPDATATSPDAVFLTESYTEGAKSDATLTVGFGGGLAGIRRCSHRHPHRLDLRTLPDPRVLRRGHRSGLRTGPVWCRSQRTPSPTSTS